MKTCLNCEKKKLSLLNGLNYKELEKLERNRTVVRYGKGEMIYKEGTKPMGLLCLDSGKAKIIRRGTNGLEQIVGLKKPFDFIGIHALMSESFYHNSAVAIEEASICVIDKDDFFEVVNNNSKLSMRLIQMLTKELDVAETRFINMTQKFLRARLADTILHLIDVYGIDTDGQTLSCTMARSELAAMSNMSTANVIRTLSDFEKEKLVSLVKKKIKIVDLEKMQLISIGS